MKRGLTLLLLLFVAVCAVGQLPLRPDAFPPVEETKLSKGLAMATSIGALRQWNAYPTYETYTAFMQQLAGRGGIGVRLDTIGFSCQGRAILALALGCEAERDKPAVMFSGAIHGDELLPFHLLLHLADSLADDNSLTDSICLVINPLANPDGTYHGGDNEVASAWRYNNNGVDLNRNFPDPWGAVALDTLQQENSAMIDYMTRHHFMLSASIHSGAEVLNYPWDSFLSSVHENEYAVWWREVCQRFVNSVWQRDERRFKSVTASGMTAGGDWYVIHNGRQDYVNYYLGTRELTIEVSVVKKLPVEQLQDYWHVIAPALIGFAREVTRPEFNETMRITTANSENYTAYPNPTHGPVIITSPQASKRYDLSAYPAGVYIINHCGTPVKIVKL